MPIPQIQVSLDLLVEPPIKEEVEGVELFVEEKIEGVEEEVESLLSFNISCFNLFMYVLYDLLTLFCLLGSSVTFRGDL